MTILTTPFITFGKINISRFHGVIFQLRWLAIPDALFRLHLVEDHQIDYLNANNDNHDDEDGENFTKTGVVTGSIAFGE